MKILLALVFFGAIIYFLNRDNKGCGGDCSQGRNDCDCK